MKSFFSRKILIIGVVVLVVLGGILVFLKIQSSHPVQFEVAKRMDLREGVTVTGQVKAVSSVTLSFEKSGTVESVLKDVGDSVTYGTVLVSLENAGTHADLLEAEANLEAAQASLDALKRGSRPEEITLEKVKVANDTQALSDARSNLVAQLESALTYVDDAVGNKVDQFFSNPHSNTPALIFPVTDSQLKTNIENGRFTLEKIITDWHKDLPKLEMVGSNEEVAIWYTNKNLLAAKDFLNNVFNAIVALNTSYNLSQTTIDAWKTAVVTAKVNVDSSLSSLSSYAEKWRTAKSALTLETGQLDLLNAGSDPQDVAAQQAKVLAAQASVDKLHADLSKTELTSPISGVVTVQDAKVGQTVSVGAPLVTVIGEDGYHIETNVPETDIGKIHIGNTVDVTLDAYPGELFLGTILKIDPAETVIDGVVTYKVTVIFDKDDPKIKSGLTANLDIESQTKKGVVSVPQVVIIETDKGNFVKKKTGNSTIQIPVTLGIRDKLGNVEVMNGLSEGDEVEVIGLKNSAQ